METATTASGQQVIVAWFENKAVLRWSYSDRHRGVQRAFCPDQEFGTPLDEIPDDKDVALEVLPEAFTSDPDRLARFERAGKSPGMIAQGGRSRSSNQPRSYARGCGEEPRCQTNR